MTIGGSTSSDSDNNRNPDGRNHEMLQAKILYDYEIDDMVKQGSLEVFPLIEHLFKSNPYADPHLVLYTAVEHVREHGLPEESSFPTTLAELPDAPESDSSGPVRPGESSGEVEELAPLPQDAPTGQEEEVDVRAAIRARREARRARAQSRNSKSNVNIRGVMEDIDSLGL